MRHATKMATSGLGKGDDAKVVLFTDLPSDTWEPNVLKNDNLT